MLATKIGKAIMPDNPRREFAAQDSTALAGPAILQASRLAHAFLGRASEDILIRIA
jgi:hypothetical protein